MKLRQNIKFANNIITYLLILDITISKEDRLCGDLFK